MEPLPEQAKDIQRILCWDVHMKGIDYCLTTSLDGTFDMLPHIQSTIHTILQFFCRLNATEISPMISHIC